MEGDSIGGFRVLRQLGAGGMGVVFEAVDPKLDRRVAIKLMPVEARSEGERRLRFLREARAAAAVSHPHVVVIYEVGDDGEHGPYLVMELLRAGSLRERIQAGPIPLPEALRMAREITAGVAAAHAAGLVHRDLKPENALVTAGGAIKVADFGLAKALGPIDEARPDAAEAPTDLVLTADGAAMGSPGYMAPEQARGSAVDARSDVFALGVVLHELISGARPFRGSTPLGEIVAAISDEPPDLRELQPMVPAALAALVKRCLSREPSERPADAGALLAELEALDLTSSSPPGPPVAAPPPATDPAATRPSGRASRAWLLAGASLALIAAAGLAVRFGSPSPAAITPSAALTKGATAAPREGGAFGPRAGDAYQAPRGRPGAPPHRGPLVVPCVDVGEPCADPNEVAWCDRERTRVACCASGLVPAGEDGICGCPPGGAVEEDAIAGGCPRALGPGLTSTAIEARMLETREAMRACFVSALAEDDRASGTIRLHFVITGYGDLYDVSIDGASLPIPAVQRCVLEQLAQLRFDAPAGGLPATVVYPWSFSVGD